MAYLNTAIFLIIILFGFLQSSGLPWFKSARRDRTSTFVFEDGWLDLSDIGNLCTRLNQRDRLCEASLLFIASSWRVIDSRLERDWVSDEGLVLIEVNGKVLFSVPVKDLGAVGKRVDLVRRLASSKDGSETDL